MVETIEKHNRRDGKNCLKVYFKRSKTKKIRLKNVKKKI